MLSLHTILCPVGHDGHPARTFAADLAARFDAHVHTLRVAVDRSLDPVLDFDVPLSSPEVLDDLGAPTEPPTFGDCEVTRRGASAAHEVLVYARESHADLIVMGTRGRTGLPRLLLGSTAETVVRCAPCPVLTVGPEVTAPPVFDHLLVPFDFSPHARTALTYARELAALLGTDLTVLHVLVPPEVRVPSVFGFNASLLTTDDIAAHCLADLEAAVATVPGPTVPERCEVATGTPAICIVEAAQTLGAGLVVLASHGRTGLARLSLGSVAEQVVRTAPCPVFTVKSFGKHLLHTSEAALMPEPA